MPKVIKANGSLEVRKSEAIVKARYKLSLLAIRLINVVLSNIKETDDVNEEYVFKVKDFQEILGLKRKDFYKAVDKAVDELLNTIIKIPLNDEQKSILKVNWISSAKYNAGEVRLKISDELRPYLLELKERFLKHNLEYVLNIGSNYAVRMYEILKNSFELHNRYGNKPEITISVDELRERLEVPRIYRYNHIKTRILEKSKEELKKHTDIVFDYEEIKEKRKVTHLKFFIRPNPNKQINYNIMDKYFKNRRNFVALLRKNYSGNKKFFGYKTIDDEFYWLGLDNKGLLYATSPKSGIKDFNAIESERLYDLWFKIAKGSDLYQQLVIQGICLEELAKNNKELWNDLNEDIVRILNLDN